MSTDVEKLVEAIVAFKESKQSPSITKYTKSWILSVLEEAQYLPLIRSKFREIDDKGVDVIDFVRSLLRIIVHNESQTLYIAIAAVDLFKDVCESYSATTHVKADQVVDFMVDVMLRLDALV